MSLLFVFFWNYSTLITWILSIIVDNSLMLDCLVFFGLIVLGGSTLRENVCCTWQYIFLQHFSFSWIAYIYRLVKFIFCLSFRVDLLPFIVNKDYIRLETICRYFSKHHYFSGRRWYAQIPHSFHSALYAFCRYATVVIFPVEWSTAVRRIIR